MLVQYRILFFVLCASMVLTVRATAQEDPIKAAMSRVENRLASNYDEQQRARLRQGMAQVAQFWRTEDGDAAAFARFVETNFAADKTTRDAMVTRFEGLLEQLDGHMLAIGREFRVQSELDLGPIYPFDEVFAAYDPAAHVNDDFFRNKLAFVVLLNFPLTTLEQRLLEGAGWTRRQWAEARLAQRYAERIPAEVNLAIAAAAAESDRYIAGYNIWMHHLITNEGQRPFPPKMRLLSHWNLRDQIKADYGEGASGLLRQRMIQRVMERIVTQTIPQCVIDNPHVDWNPFTNEVRLTTSPDADAPVPAGFTPSNAPEPDTRYAVLLDTYRAQRKADPYSPTSPTHILRRFNDDREIPEPRVKQMLEQVVTSSLVPQVAKLISARLGRPLEPFDIWYNGFRPRGSHTQRELDAIVAARYPTASAFEKDIPAILTKLGFAPERAQFIASHIAVDPARGSGHAQEAAMRTDKARLRTRVGAGGMDYKGFNIAVHELGHNVEQVISLNAIDHTLLQGVPNTAFTEAIAFVFQARDMDLLGLATPDPSQSALQTLNDFWGVYEIAGVALLDMEIWHWMYDHPDATPAQLKDATLQLAKGIWNRYYAPVVGAKDVALLAVYSHIIHSFLYLPDYPIGHLIAHQVEEQVAKAGSIGKEVERMTTIGRIAPDLWMKEATGKEVGADALLESAAKALAKVATSSGY
jgi:hypothetical protein